MNFHLAYMQMQEGLKIRRPGWKGYWHMKNGKMGIYLENGELLDDCFDSVTIYHCSKNDWEVVK